MITTILEHPGILEAMRSVEKQGGEVTYIPVEENGIVNPQNIKQALKPSTVLVSVMLANNEIGTIQPLREISRLIDEYRRDSGSGASTPYLHTDASQAGNYLDLSFQKLGVDMMTLDSSKVYGPKGIGLLALKKHVALEPIIVGGGQERGLRAGTENVPHIVGFAAALKIAQAIREKESVRLSTLREYFFDAVIKDIPGVYIHGDREQRLPNTINICIPGIDAEFTVIKLDRAGIACSSASSCLNLSENSYSYVVDALDAARARRSDGEGRRCRESSLRFTMGRASRKKDLDLTLRALRDILITQ